MPVDHSHLILLAKKLGYHSNKNGMCRSIAIMAMQAVLAKDIDTFSNRFMFIENQINKKNIDEFVKDIKKVEQDRVVYLKRCREHFLRRTGKSINMEDKDFYTLLKNYNSEDPALKEYYEQRNKVDSMLDPGFVDVRAFIQLISLHFFPKKYPNLFSKEVKHSVTNPESTLIRGLPDSLLEITTTTPTESKEIGETSIDYKEESLVKKIGSIGGSYNIQELEKFFEILLSQPSTYSDVFEEKSSTVTTIPSLQDLKDPPVFFLTSDNRDGSEHSIIVFYCGNPTNSWFLFDSNKILLEENETVFVACETAADIANEVFSSFTFEDTTYPDVHAFDTSLFGTKDQVEILTDWFENKRSSLNNLTLLNKAASDGDLNLVNEIIENNKSIKSIYSSYDTALFLAAKNGHLGVVKLLFELNANPTAIRDNDRTALHIAAEMGHLDILKLFFQEEIYLVREVDDNKTLIDLAAQNGHLDVVVWLIERGSKLTLNSNEMLPLLQKAVLNGDVDVFKTIFKKRKNDLDLNTKLQDGNTLLHLAAANGNINIVKELLKNKSPFSIGLQSKNKEVTIDSLTANGSTALFQAVVKKHSEVVEFLLKKGADPRLMPHDGKSAFFIAVELGDIKMLKTFLDSRLSIKQNFDLPVNIDPIYLTNSSKEITKQNIELLFHSDKKIEDFTPLHAAIFFGHKEIVNLLITHGFDLNKKTKNGISGLDLAIAMNHDEIANILRAAGLKEENEVKIHLPEKQTTDDPANKLIGQRNMFSPAVNTRPATPSNDSTFQNRSSPNKTP